ncbi:MAG: HAD family hydrolase [Tissierellia bacterium]|nr:HAD family hydrolase [Tissierellia bacterium]
MDKTVLSGVKTIYFDFDGTLHDTVKIYGESLRIGFKYMIDQGMDYFSIPTDEEAVKWLGYNAPEMWLKLLPDEHDEFRLKVSKMVGQHMNEMLRTGKGSLYKGAKEVLETLKKRGYTLIYLSNCKNVYREAVVKAYNIGHLFDAQFCSESFDFIPKEEIIKKVRHYFPEEQIVIGDRFHDMKAAKKNNLNSIFCKYGYGQMEEGQTATLTIDSVDEILEILD